MQDDRLVGDEAVGQPHHHHRLKKSYDEQKVVSQFTGTLRDVRLDG